MLRHLDGGELDAVCGGLKWEGERQSSNVIDCRGGPEIDTRSESLQFEKDCLGYGTEWWDMYTPDPPPEPQVNTDNGFEPNT